LCDLKTKVIKTNIDISKIRANNDDFMLSDLSKCLNVKTRNDVIVRSYLEYAHRHSTLVFAVDIEHVEKLRQAFLDAQIEAYSLTSKTPAHIRAEVIKKFREKKFSVLVNCGILTEGTDIPNIDCIIMGRPTKSPVLFQQMIGRGMRLHEGKKDCLILDFIDSSTKHIPDLVTSPTLLGLTTSNVLVGGERNDDQNAELIPIIPTSNGIYMNTLSPNDVIDKERIDRLTSQIKEISNINVEEYLSVNELIDDCSSASHIKVISDNAWVRVGYESYVLSLSIKGSIKLDRDTDGRFKAKYRSVKYKTKAKSDDVIPIRSVQPLPIIGDRLDTAIKACDSWVKFKFGNKLSFILASRFTRWRNQPITKQQLNWIKKRNPLLTDDKLCHLEKGSASNLMTQIIEGAEKNWEKFQKEKGKKEKLLKKLKSQTVQAANFLIDAKLDDYWNIIDLATTFPITLNLCTKSAIFKFGIELDSALNYIINDTIEWFIDEFNKSTNNISKTRVLPQLILVVHGIQEIISRHKKISTSAVKSTMPFSYEDYKKSPWLVNQFVSTADYIIEAANDYRLLTQEITQDALDILVKNITIKNIFSEYFNSLHGLFSSVTEKIMRTIYDENEHKRGPFKNTKSVKDITKDKINAYITLLRDRFKGPSEKMSDTKDQVGGDQITKNYKLAQWIF
ncbi:16404_t:CDS:2, partial [Entrophospora sp. SA101]